MSKKEKTHKTMFVSDELYKFVFKENLKDIKKTGRKVSMNYTLRRLLKLKQK